ncbi:MAG: metalloregulator ArsR/SmtB family transcription factor [Chloroflexota bacterium]|nr:metalloregulator ArsR/SmtB family transcription factor [Chloroflexota bacterium]
MPKRPDAFDALADPTRRAILEMLRGDGDDTAGAIAAAFPEISRPAVSRHLRILRESGLIVVRKSGRECHYALDERGLLEVYQGWLAQFEPIWDRALRALKQQVGQREPTQRHHGDEDAPVNSEAFGA